MSPNRLAQILQSVGNLLEKNLVLAPPVNVEAIASALGIHVRKTPTDDEVSGFLLKQGDVSLIGVNALHHPNRQRFTIAHEIGHFVLDHFDQVHVDKAVMKLRDEASRKGIHKEEVEANRFAAELLMPREFLRQELSRGTLNDLLDDRGMQQLAKRFQVSVQAMSNRLASLGYIASSDMS